MKIFIENDVATKLKYYTEFAEGEVSGMGKTKINEDGDIVFIDIALFDQECSGTTTDIDDESMAKFMYEMRQKGESLSDWNLWWHTHAEMSVFWSPQDNKCISDHSSGNNYLISVVTNKAGDYKGRLDVFPKDNSPFEKEFTPVTYDLDVAYYIDEGVQEAVDTAIESFKKEQDELKEKVKELDEIIDSAGDVMLESEIFKAECEAEVGAKVRKPTPVTNSHSYKSPGWDSSKAFKKRESYYARDEKRQKEFEDVLDDVQWGLPVEDVIEYEEDPITDWGECPECQNPVVLCDCPDALEKYGHLFFDEHNYIANQFPGRKSGDRLLSEHAKNMKTLPLNFNPNGK